MIRKVYEAIDAGTFGEPDKKILNEKTIEVAGVQVEFGFKNGTTQIFDMSLEQYDRITNFISQTECPFNYVSEIENLFVFGLNINEIVWYRVVDWLSKEIFGEVAE